MSRLLSPVHPRVNRSILVTLALLLCTPAFAIDVDPRLDKAVRAVLPVCAAEAKITYDTMKLPLPQGFKGVVFKIDSARPSCTGQFTAVSSSTGGLFIGSPWPISKDEGTTIEEKLRNFTARNMRESMDVTIVRTATEDGLWPVTLLQSTEAGKLPLSGFVDPQGQIFFLGSFRRANGDLHAQRAKSFDAFVAQSPAKGAASGAVTIIEFSDFQCPSCKRSSGYVESILAKHADKVRYIRYDLPLSGHPWAFPAALAGRAIHRQKPDLFWDYKKAVYGNQDTLNAFTFWDWARAWAEDHDLDMARYDADLTNAEVRAELLKGAGAAFSNDVRATPTYFVNGVIVDPGDDGKVLADYVEKLVTK